VPWCGPPLPLTGLVGREREMARLRVLIGGHRLVTLTGPGGCGKTRLAAAVAGEVAPGLADGVCWVELATLADPALVPQAVARALDVREQPGQRLEQVLCRRLGSVGLLLVLDNCEHLAGACAVLAAGLVSRCGGLRIVATSRVSLGVTGEIIWPVPPLAVPDPGNLPPVPSLLRYEAVRLLAERAAAVEPGFTVDADNARAVAQVCYRLDGMPLAIELAAARVRVLTVQEIAARLEDSFAVLAGRSPAALPRQQTLRATMDWSHDLLSEAARVLFRRLSVFAGGFTLEAAEAVRRAGRRASGGAGGADVAGGQVAGRGRKGAGRGPGTGCWRRSASTGWTSCATLARSRECAAGTPGSSWTWPNRPSRRSTPGTAAGGWPAWRTNTTTSGRSWPPGKPAMTSRLGWPGRWPGSDGGGAMLPRGGGGCTRPHTAVPTTVRP
jgi:hypothetical protein